MSIMLRTALIVISLLTLWYTARKIRKAQLQIEDSIFWMAFPAALVILSVFPDFARGFYRCYRNSQRVKKQI